MNGLANGELVTTFARDLAKPEIRNGSLDRFGDVDRVPESQCFNVGTTFALQLHLLTYTQDLSESALTHPA